MLRDEWIGRARQELDRLKGPGPSWGYRPGGEPSVEPTVLALLGSLAVADDEETLAQAKKTAEWLAGLQQDDGSLGLSAAHPQPGWPTALALLAFQAVGGHEAERKKGIQWLLASKGKTYVRDPSVMGHDSQLVGWPWMVETHSWIEPTTMALLALAGEGLQLNERFREALQLIRNRALPKGGWNYGNTIVLGTETRPQPAPTGLSLVALSLPRAGKAAGKEAAQPDKDEAEKVARGCEYLEKLLPKIRSPLSLCWGLLGLTACDRRPAEADAWLAEAAQKSAGWSDPAVEWSLLLLAAGSRNLELLNARPKKAEAGKAG